MQWHESSRSQLLAGKNAIDGILPALVISCCTAPGETATVEGLSHLGLLKGPTLFAYKVTLSPSLNVCDAAFTEAAHREAASANKQKALPRMVFQSGFPGTVDAKGTMPCLFPA